MFKSPEAPLCFLLLSSSTMFLLMQALMDILQQDRREAAEQRQELCDIIARLQEDLQGAEDIRDKVSTRQTSPCSSYKLTVGLVLLNCVCSWSRSVSSCS